MGSRTGCRDGRRRWTQLERIGAENFAAMRDDARATRGIDAAWEEPGVIDVATRPHEVAGLAEAAETARRHGEEVTLLDREAVRAEVDSPTYLGGLWSRSGGALVDPAGWPGACATRRCATACGSTSTRP